MAPNMPIFSYMKILAYNVFTVTQMCRKYIIELIAAVAVKRMDSVFCKFLNTFHPLGIHARRGQAPPPAPPCSTLPHPDPHSRFLKTGLDPVA